MKRLAALLAAVAMIAGAWALRDALDDDGSGSGSGGGGSEVPEQLQLTCATELAAACNQLLEGRDDLEVTIQDPGITADTLAELPAGADPGFDAWLVDGPWAAMVADDRSFGGVRGEVLAEPSAVLARSPGLIAVQRSRQADLAGMCGETVTWRCVGEHADALRVGISTPNRGDGLVTLSQATSSYFDTTTYSAVDFEEPGFSAWFDALTSLSRRTTMGARSALATAVGQAGTFGVVGALESQASTLLRGRDDWTTIYPEPMSTADVQLVPRTGLDADDLLDRLDAASLIEALGDQGWRPAPGTGDPALPDTAGLPSAGVLNALRDRW